MIVGHFDIGRALRRPPEANPELVVDPDRMLALTVALERFETITWRLPQIVDVDGGIKLAKLTARNLDQIRREASRAFAAEHSLSQMILEAPDHG